MGRLTLALGYILTGDERLLHEYNRSFGDYLPMRPIQPPPSAEWLRFVKGTRANEAAKRKLAQEE